MSGLRTWSIEDPDGLDATDYIIGATLGRWSYDEDSMLEATVVALTRVLVQAGLHPESAFEKAWSTVVPEAGERSLGISVVKTDGAYKVSFDFGKDDEAPPSDEPAGQREVAS